MIFPTPDIRSMNIDILKKNIQRLIEYHDVKQEDLATAIGTSQPNLSRILKVGNKQQPTFEQTYKIAQFFNVSLDSLLSDEKISFSGKKLTEYELGKILSNIFNSFKVELVDFSRKEEHYEITKPISLDEFYEEPYKYESITKTVKYNALIFPKHWDPSTGDMLLLDDIIDVQQEASMLGTELEQNTKINDFISKFKVIHDLYTDKKLPLDAYTAALNQYLSELKDKPK